MDRQEKGKSGRASLTAAKEELHVMPIPDREIERRAHSAAEVRFDFSPFGMRTKSAVKFLE
jgi:hypothetical protein